MKPIKILFVCRGNICRSPTAMFLLRYRLKELGLENEYEVFSAGLENSTAGEDMYIEAQEELQKHNIPFSLHAAHKITPKEYLEQDYVLCMENLQKIEIKRMMSHSHNEKLHRLYDYTGECRDIMDPFFTGDFPTAYSDIEKGVSAFVEKEILIKKKAPNKQN